MRGSRELINEKQYVKRNSVFPQPYNIPDNYNKNGNMKIDEKAAFQINNNSSSQESNSQKDQKSQNDSHSKVENESSKSSNEEENEEESDQTESSLSKGDLALENLFDLKKWDIFSFARHNKFHELETLFIQGLNPDSKDEYGNTILIIAAQNDNKRIVKLALRYGSQINMPNSMGNTALHFASEYRYPNVYEYLIQKGADPELRNIRGIKAKDGIKRATVNSKNLFLGYQLNQNGNSAKMNKILKKIV